MRELSLYILDIVQNSIAAQATWVEIIIEENLDKDYLDFYSGQWQGYEARTD